MTRITEMASMNNEDQENPFDALDLTPDTLNTMSDAELDALYAAVHEIWRTQGSKEDDDGAIAASIVINNQYMLRGRELPNKDKLDEISETKQKVAITGGEVMKLPVVGNLLKCSICKRNILIERALTGTSHTSGILVTCWNCLTEEQKKKAKERYELKKGGED